MPIMTLISNTHSTLHTHHSHPSLSRLYLPLKHSHLHKTTNTLTFSTANCTPELRSPFRQWLLVAPVILVMYIPIVKWRIAPIEYRLWHSQGIQDSSWVSVGEFRRIVVGFKCLQESSLLSFTLFIEPISVLRVTLRESKRHVGAYGANDPAYDIAGYWT
ncbi:hypothetical protein PIB30_052425 [Stylosanthes scabra]|uniref:Uncharacterized protein n=1 Tax=Stylosanthes scabra TaxID=79078 RepID=A0ABU6THW8_9FABA|nr:hypothetical protein [Stylosanthes scabra]